MVGLGESEFPLEVMVVGAEAVSMHLHNFLLEPHICFCGNYIVTAAKQLKADWLEFAAPKDAGFVSFCKKTDSCKEGVKVNLEKKS